MSDLTVEGERLVSAWLGAVERAKIADRERGSAQCAELNAMNKLGRWLLPEDAKEGEQFCVWHGSSLLCATKKPGGMDVVVTIRKKGRGL